MTSYECTLVFVMEEHERTRERAGLLDACDDQGIEYRLVRSSEVKLCVSELSSTGRQAIVIYPDPHDTMLPGELPLPEITAIALQIDTYSEPKLKAAWASLFDVVVVFHPGFDEYYRRMHHPGVIMLPHAARASELYSARAGTRDFDVGWVGSLDGKKYALRRQTVSQLASRFRMNEWRRYHSEDEVSSVYRRSKVVVNVSREDHPHDANLRCFEAMAAGALLVTSLPTELTEVGFEEGRDFIGYTDQINLLEVVREALCDEQGRLSIADRGHRKVADRHLYDHRLKEILCFARRNSFGAPARRWCSARRSQIYAEYFAKKLCASNALRYMISAAVAKPALIPWLLKSMMLLYLRLARRLCSQLASPRN